MKIGTHPKTAPTLIQSKDGSSYTKYWRYSRVALTLEVDPKAWEQPRSRSSVKFVKSIEKKGGASQSTKQALQFPFTWL